MREEQARERGTHKREIGGQRTRRKRERQEEEEMERNMVVDRERKIQR